MKHLLQKTFALKALLLMSLLVGAVSGAWADPTTGTITFGKNDVVINDQSVTGDDDLGNSWTITTTGTTSFTSNADYYQVGSSKSPATSITFTMSLSEDVNITSFSAKFGGFSGTAGDITLKVGETTVGEGSLNATTAVEVTSTKSETGKVLTVTVTNIDKGVKCYNISYTYTAAADPGKPTPELSFPKESYTANLGESFTAPTLTNESGVDVSFSSSKTSVATVDEETGAVTIVGEGETDITAAFAGNEEYNQASASYTLTVTDNSAATNIVVNADGITNTNRFDGTEAGSLSATVYVGEDVVDGATVTWESSNESVATIDDNGVVTLVAAGTTTLTANYAGVVGQYKGSTQSYTLTVVYNDPSIAILWSEDFGDNFDDNSDTYQYVLTNGDSNTSLWENALAGGESPELLVGKNKGSFKATIPLVRVQGDLTLTYKTNTTNLTVSSTTKNVSLSGDTTPKGNKATSTVTISGITTDFSEIVIVFTNTNKSSNVRLDDIVLKGSQLAEGDVASPVINVEETFIGSTTATITCTTQGAAIKYSFDGETWNDYTEPLAITATTTIYAKAVKDEEESSVVSKTVTKTLPTPTVTIDATGITNTNVYEGTEAGSLSASVTYDGAALEGATVTWSGDNDEVATINAQTGAVTLVGAGSVTFTATYAGNADYSEAKPTYQLTVTNSDPNVPGTENNPYTVAQARAAIDAGTGVTGVYATGIVSEIVTEYSSQYKNITFDISVDGKETSDQLRAYRCGGTDAADAADVQVGDIVIISGNLILYNEDIYEFAQGCKLESLVHPAATICAAPTFNPESGEVVAGAKVTISTTTEDATIHYTIDGTEPTTSSSVYSEPITITETTTIKAIAVKEGMTNSTVATATYTIALPVATPTFTPAAGTYGSAQVVAISCETDDATIYYSYDNEIWTEYTEALNINESKTVYAKAEKEGLVTSYANAAYTMQIPSITFVNDATPKNLTYEAQNYDFAFEGAYTIGSFTVVVCDYEGNATSYDWFSAELNDNTVRVTLTQNEDMENSRTAFFKVTADNATSEVFSVVQNNFVPDYATLPFAYDGNATGELPDGLTQNGLGTKTYGTSPKIGFDTTDDYLILKINERPGTLTFDIKGNTFSGGTFKVQTSEDGVTYTDLETYTDLGATQNEEFTNLGENVRYIKWIYTEKDNGNVALGNIKLAEYTEPVIVPSITLSSYSIYATAAETEGALELTYENFDISDASDFDVLYCDSEGEETDAPEWIEVVITEDYAVSYTIEANEGDARTAYFKVYAMDDETNLVYSDIVTITQEAYVAPLPSITYSLASSITSGKHYLITNGNKIVMGADKGNNRNAVEVNLSDSKLSVTDEAVQEVVICGPDANGYYTLYADGYLYAASSSSNYLKTQATADANGLWSIVIDEYGVAAIQAKGSYTRNNMRYNSGNNIFSCYGSGQNDIYLYERDDEEAPEANYSRATSVDNWGTICLPNTATIIGAELYSIEGVDSKDAPSVVYLNEYKGTAVAGTPYLFKATENAIHAYYTGDAAEEALNNNGLVGSFERMDVTEGKYLLSNGVIVRCGENCHIGANRAYIDMSEVPEYEETGEAGVKMLYLNDITTGINGIDANGEGAVIYDLSGRRLSKAQKGLYIVNGKKVSVK